MAREIMVPLDGTSFSEAALPYAIMLARRDRARIRLVSAWRPLPPHESDSSWERERMAWLEEDRDRLEAYLREMSSRVARASGGSAEVEVLEGHVDEVLPRWCAAADLDVAVMTTHARAPVLRAWIGSVADHMVREGRHPVLLIHPPSEEPSVDVGAAPPFGRVLVPLDGSELAETALDRNLLAGEGGSGPELVLLRVIPLVPHSTPLSFPAPLTGPGQVIEETRRGAEAYLGRSRRASGRLGATGGERDRDGAERGRCDLGAGRRAGGGPDRDGHPRPRGCHPGRLGERGGQGHADLPGSGPAFSAPRPLGSGARPLGCSVPAGGCRPPRPGPPRTANQPMDRPAHAVYCLLRSP